MKWLNFTFALFSRLFVIAGLILSFYARKRMGILRSMVYWNQKLFSTVLSHGMLKIYIAVVVLLILWVVYKIIIGRIYTIREAYPMFIAGVTSVVFIYFLEGTIIIGLPLIVIGMFLGFVDSLIKLVSAK